MANNKDDEILQKQFSRIGFWPVQNSQRDFAGFNVEGDFSFSIKPGESLKTVCRDIFFKTLEALPDKAGEKKFWTQIDKAYKSLENQDWEMKATDAFKQKYHISPKKR